MTPALLALAAAAGLAWQAVAAGAWRAEARMAERGPLANVRVVALELDPARVRFELVTATRDQGTRAAWRADSLPPGAIAACNAGQFSGPSPWGWLVRDGREEQPAGTGSLAMAFVVDTAGRPGLVTAGERGARRGRIALGFESYPALLTGDGALPPELLAAGRGVDLDHRDSRLALGVRADGSVLVALTRFTGLGDAGAELPWGPTLGEMAAWMRTQGCRRAVMLDGGLSSQMAIRSRDGAVKRWTNWRAVPMGMVVLPRPAP